MSGSATTRSRGGAKYRAFDYSKVKDAPPFPEIGEVDEKEMWARFLYFAKPPVPVMRGVARIFHYPDGLRRFLKEVPSKHSGITFCQGTIAEMGVNVLEEIRHFGKQGKIFLVQTTTLARNLVVSLAEWRNAISQNMFRRRSWRPQLSANCGRFLPGSAPRPLQ